LRQTRSRKEEIVARSDAHHGRSRIRLFLGVLLVLVIVAAASTVWTDAYDKYVDPRIDKWFGDEPAKPPPDPVTVAPPPGLELPAVTRPAAAADVVDSAPLSPAEVRTALAPYLNDADLGRHVVAAVAPLAAGKPTYVSGSGLAIPASTTKLVTSTAALLALGEEHTFETTVVAGGPRRVVLVGGGDPFLQAEPPDDETPYPHRADVVTLAKRTAAALKAQGKRRVSVGYDDTLFTGPAVNPTWEKDYVPDVTAPVSSLWVDEGRSPTGFGRVLDPALTAATVFAGALAKAGIEVIGIPERGVADGGGAELASVESAPLGQIIERILEVSDNEASEVLLRHVGEAAVGDASFTGGQRGVKQVLGEAGVRLGSAVLYDGSGLSRANRIAPATLIDVLRLATSANQPDLRPILTGLPVAGFSGSLADRFDGPLPEARGRVRAKTGTLTGVHSLAGIAIGPDGAPMLFALMTDQVRLPDNTDAEVTIDNAAAALGACSCGA
jgi:D-alanyl-D-alanine carboxypeptidase/D-alanyl-D-alanine-endopeptidase (penicillin-binding protein 4)